MESISTLLSVLTPLVALPITVITFYLKSLREQHVAWRGECMRRMTAIELGMGRMERAASEFQRDYATKEEWLRECLQARADLHRLTEAVVRVETHLEWAGPRLREARRTWTGGSDTEACPTSRAAARPYKDER